MDLCEILRVVCLCVGHCRSSQFNISMVSDIDLHTFSIGFQIIMEKNVLHVFEPILFY